MHNDNDNDQKYQDLKKEISEFLSLASTQKKLSEYRDKNQARSHLKKHLLLLLRADINSIQKALDELMIPDND